MAENNTYHLYVHTGAESRGSKKVVVGQDVTDKTPSYGDKVAKNMTKAVTGFVSWKSAESFADNLIGYEISQVELRTGAREYEQKLQFGYSVGKKVVDSGIALGIGIATGTWPLVLAGLAVSGINTAISISQKANTLRTQQNLEDISIGFANIRAGVSGRRGANQ